METDVIFCHDRNVTIPYVRTSGNERLREFRMQARNAFQTRLQSGWRESLALFFSILAYARFSCRVWPSAKFSFAFHHGDVSFDVSIVYMYICAYLYMSSTPAAIFCDRCLPIFLWIPAKDVFDIVAFNLKLPFSVIHLCTRICAFLQSQ